MSGRSDAAKSISTDAAAVTRRPKVRMGKLTKMAKGVCTSTEDLCKSTNMYKTWDTRQMMKHWRHAPWMLLRDHKTLCAVWLNDVLAYHGSKKPLGDYYLIVQHPRIAAGVLSLYGYKQVGWTNDQTVLSQFQCQRIKLSAPGAKVDVVLLSANEWCYDLSWDALHDGLCPYLPEFIDSMMELWLRVPSRSRVKYSCLMDFLATIIHECYGLNDFGDDVCANSYSTWLKPHHREVHFDIVARSKGFVKDNLDFQSRHRYHVHKSDLIKVGRFIPRPRRKKPYNPQLPILLETPEDTKPSMKSPRRQYFIATVPFEIYPDPLNIGIAL